MRLIFATIALLCTNAAIPEQLDYEWWLPGNFGAPCTTMTDINEGTCNLEVNEKPDWSKN